MSISLLRLQDLLLDMLGTCRQPDVSLTRSMDSSDWRTFMEMVEQHRLAPLLYWRLTHEHTNLPIPAAIRSRLEQEFKASAMRGLLLQRELILIHRMLEQAQIPYAALKGAYLALFSYPHPALRPLRDLDYLVPRERALEAFSVLLEGGLVRHALSRGNPEAALEQKKHLPAILTPVGNIWVELHTRLSDSETNDLASQDIWERTIQRPIASVPMKFLSPADQLLHLIIHAVYDHRFSNGPLLASDIAYLIQNEEIDWEQFWKVAARLQSTKGCELSLRMAQRYYGGIDISWPDQRELLDRMPEGLVATTSRLTLRDFEGQGFSNLQSEALGNRTPAGKLLVYMKRLFPARTEIASRYPVPADSVRVYLWYPAWWGYVAGRVWSHFRKRDRDIHISEAQDLSLLDRWLQ